MWTVEDTEEGYLIVNEFGEQLLDAFDTQRSAEVVADAQNEIERAQSVARYVELLLAKGN